MLKQKLASILITAGLLASTATLPGCHGDAAALKTTPSNSGTISGPTTSAVGAQPVARVNDLYITRDELYRPLIEAYGLNMLLNLVQLDLAKQVADRDKIIIKPEDIRAERDLTLAKMFTDATKDDYEQLLGQFLNQQHLSRAEFDMVLETNAYLRKIAEPQLAGKITDDNVHSAFNQIYGENRQIRDIELLNLREWTVAKQRTEKEPFELVARQMSHDRRAANLGGEWPPFSSQSQQVPKEIKDVTFTLKQDQISPDPIQSGNDYHLIKLVNIIAPKVVKFEDVKDSVRQSLDEQWIQLAMKELRNQLGQLALRDMQILEPAIKAQFDEKAKAQTGKMRDRDEIRNQLTRHRESATMPSTTQTTTAPAGQPPVDERPPATMPAAK